MSDNTYDSTLGGRIAPRLVITGEDAEMTSTDEFLVIETENGVVGAQKVGMENDLDPVMRVIEELHAANLVQDRVVRVVHHIVRRDRWETVPFERKDAAFEKNLVLIREEVGRLGELREVAASYIECVSMEQKGHRLGKH